MSEICRRYDSLTSMRAFAALLVFGFHINLGLTAPLTSQGRLGVSFFFILSGLLLGLVYRPSVTALGFYRRRLARLYPAYVVALALGLVVSLWLGSNQPGWRGILTVVGAHAWVPDSDVYYAWNPVSWSLSDELFFYLLFPLIAPTVIRLGARATWAVRAGCAGVIVAAGVFAAIDLPNTFEQPNNIVAWATYVLPATRLAEFVLGLTLVRAVRGPRLPVPKWAAVTLLAVAYLASAGNPPGIGMATLTAAPLALLLVVFCQADAAGERSVLHHRFLVRAGEVSYCFYLVHHLAIRVCGHVLDTAPTGVAPVSSLLVAAVGAWLLHRWIEVPCERRFNGVNRSVLNAREDGAGERQPTLVG